MNRGFLFLVIVAAAIPVFAGVATAGEGMEMTPYRGSAELEWMKENLEGEWEGSKATEGGTTEEMEVQYVVTSNGSAVIEVLSPGTDNEMVSVYHDENGKLAMTHYCALGNQPKLVLQSSSGDEIFLSLAQGSPIPQDQPHMHSLKLSYNKQEDTLRQEWTSYEEGKPAPALVFTLTRVEYEEDEAEE
ncbi:MAG: hypothetical protein NC819_03845 [Candidatus Omnitrophica bacterium]|nr:hypothetical protein [Candidatus Omnitrophota bacterium]